MESADTTDLKSVAQKAYGFKSRSGYQFLRRREQCLTKSRQPLEKILFSPLLSFLFVWLFLLSAKTALFTIGRVALRYSTWRSCVTQARFGPCGPRVKSRSEIPVFMAPFTVPHKKADSRLRKFYFLRCCLFFFAGYFLPCKKRHCSLLEGLPCVTRPTVLRYSGSLRTFRPRVKSRSEIPVFMAPFTVPHKKADSRLRKFLFSAAVFSFFSGNRSVS